MAQPLFRKESMKRVASPEQLSDYMQVTSPAVWALLIAVVLLLASFFIWSSTAAIESYAPGRAEVRDGVLTLSFEDEEKAANVSSGMELKVGDTVLTVSSVGRDKDGKTIAVAQTELPDGSYDASVGYKRTQIIEMLFN